jgi:5-hydroxyisourate hydrolase
MSSPVGGLSIHAVDVALGRVAEGLPVQVWRLGGERVAAGRINARGLLDDAALMGERLVAGGYEVVFDVGAYHAEQRPAGMPGFLREVPYRFHIAEGSGHTHLPFKFTPWGFSLFRGGA